MSDITNTTSDEIVTDVVPVVAAPTEIINESVTQRYCFVCKKHTITQNHAQMGGAIGRINLCTFCKFNTEMDALKAEHGDAKAIIKKNANEAAQAAKSWFFSAVKFVKEVAKG